MSVLTINQIRGERQEKLYGYSGVFYVGAQFNDEVLGPILRVTCTQSTRQTVVVTPTPICFRRHIEDDRVSVITVDGREILIPDPRTIASADYVTLLEASNEIIEAAKSKSNGKLRVMDKIIVFYHAGAELYAQAIIALLSAAKSHGFVPFLGVITQNEVDLYVVRFPI